MTVKVREDNSIIALDHFIQSTRDSGYKSTVSAVSELVDNSLQAGARRIEVILRITDDDSKYPIIVSIRDDGEGMTRSQLRESLRFGGSSRFDDRTGMGRYGMGLPNASLSQARRVEVTSWQNGKTPLMTFLDVDAITEREMAQVPSPKSSNCRMEELHRFSSSGTEVVWKCCDRLDNRRISTIEKKLKLALGRIFRHFIWSGHQLTINGEQVRPMDPLYLHPESLVQGGVLFKDPIEIEMRVPGTKKSSFITIRFVELPVEKWSVLSVVEKKSRGIANNAGVSMVRAGREIDYGWFFLKGKRRENYDDWWRCEICFDPELDELFGITHTKQQVRPQELLLEVIAPQMEEMARLLNRRVRDRFLAVKTQNVGAKSMDKGNQLARRGDLGSNRQVKKSDRKQLEALSVIYPKLLENGDGGAGYFEWIEEPRSEQEFFLPVAKSDGLIVLLNERHPFYLNRYKPLMRALGADAVRLRDRVQALLLSAAQAEIKAADGYGRSHAVRYRREWSCILERLTE